eukprot:gene16838-8309_t
MDVREKLSEVHIITSKDSMVKALNPDSKGNGRRVPWISLMVCLSLVLLVALIIVASRLVAVTNERSVAKSNGKQGPPATANLTGPMNTPPVFAFERKVKVIFVDIFQIRSAF